MSVSVMHGSSNLTAHRVFIFFSILLFYIFNSHHVFIFFSILLFYFFDSHRVFIFFSVFYYFISQDVKHLSNSFRTSIFWGIFWTLPQPWKFVCPQACFTFSRKVNCPKIQGFFRRRLKKLIPSSRMNFYIHFIFCSKKYQYGEYISTKYPFSI